MIKETVMKRFISILALALVPLFVTACNDGATNSHSTQPEFRAASTDIRLLDLTPSATPDLPAEGGLVHAPPGTITYHYDAEEKRLVIRHFDALFRDGDTPLSLRMNRQENIITIIEEQFDGEGPLRRYDLTAEIRDLPAAVYRVLVVEPWPAAEQLPLTFKLDLAAGTEGRFDRPRSAELASLSR